MTAIDGSLRWTLGVALGVAFGVAVTGLPRAMRADDPRPDVPKAEAKKATPPGEPPATPVAIDGMLTPEWEAKLPKEADIRPAPAFEIPDDPPPHEGALIDVPLTIQPPDLIVVEVLEALPGRPIQGERLVRPDGTITLGFYGDIHVAGLTPVQVKEKVVLRLRRFLTDQAIGLVGEHLDPPPAAAGPAPEGRPPGDGPPPKEDRRRDPSPPKPPDEAISPFDAPPKSPPPNASPEAGPRTSNAAAGHGRRLVRTAQGKGKELKEPRFPVRQPAADGTLRPPADVPRDGPAAAGMEPGAEAEAREDSPAPGRLILIPPAESDRVFVDVSNYNHTCWYIQGDVITEGRFPHSGSETVLDALNYAGGLSATADEAQVQLIRPGRNGKPAKIYTIDLAAIRDRGEAKANLQMFPGDRLVVGRSAIVTRTLKTNQRLAESSTVLGHLTTYAYAMRALNNIQEPYNPNAPMSARLKIGGLTLNMSLGPDAPFVDPARRQAALKAWAEMISDDPKVREELQKMAK